MSEENLPIIESLVTYLEMNPNPGLVGISLGEFLMYREDCPLVEEYLDLYRAVGRDYIWNYRPGQTREEIQAIIQSPSQWLYMLKHQDRVVGMAELDATDPKNIELVHFGLIPTYIHRGIGKAFLQNIIAIVWESGALRLWLSTCGMDHPKAIHFYERAGFKIFKTTVAEFKDYRFSDFYSLQDAPQIPFGRRRSEESA